METLEIESKFVKLHLNDDMPFGWGYVDYWTKTAGGHSEGFSVQVYLDDLTVPAADLKRIALEKANALIKAIAVEISKE